MISKRKFCIKNILKQNVPCKNPKVTWVIPESDCMTTPCEGCTDECIEISILEGCQHNKIKVIVECPDCDDCPPIIDDITFCIDDEDCDKCSKCENGICVDKCGEGEYCDDKGNCNECAPGTCEDGKECINGKCICPPGKIEIDDICYECSDDSHCGPCEVCNKGKCVARECFNGVCNPETEECADCLNSGDCGENEQCVDNECVCAPGFTYKPGEGCVPSPECGSDSDCGDCYICTNEGCVERKCPEGTVCYKDECVPLCDCDNPFCTGADRDCIEVKPGTCGCVKGEPNPCKNRSCNNGIDCGEGCGCVNGECLPCESLDCNSNECAESLGCECQGSNCVDSKSKCRGECANGSDCGPGCGCLNGKCVPCGSFDCDDCDSVEGCGCEGDTCIDLKEDCIDSFKINKSDSRCSLEARLITANKCQCNRISLSTEVSEYGNQGAVFKVQLREGDADLNGLMNLSLLRDTDVVNYAPSTGRVNVKVIERGVGSGFGATIYERDYNLSGTDEIETEILPVNPIEGVTGIDVVFTVPKRSLKFDSGCSYSEEEEKITYKLNSVGRNGFIKYENLSSANVKYSVLESSDDRTPLFTWYATSQGVEDKVRTVYARKESEGVYVDGWVGISQGIRPGMYYRVESDCACDKEANLVCPGTNKAELLTYCNPKDITERLVYTLKDCYKTIELKEIYNIFPVCDANSRILQPYSLYLNGEKKAMFPAQNMQVSIAGTFSLNEPIETIQIKLEGNNCDDCYEPIRVTGTEVEIENIDYDCNTQKLGYSISGGSGEYRVYADGDPTKEPNNLTKGEHTITFEDVGSGCAEERSISVDCCSAFEVNAANSEYCEGKDSFVNISLSNGEAPFNIKLLKGDQEVDSFTTSGTSVTRTLPENTSGNVNVEVEDFLGCTSSDIFRVTEVSGPTISVSNTTYCSGDTEIDVILTVNQLSDILITNGGNVEYNQSREGTFTATLDIKSSKTYTVVASSGDCETEIEFTIQELPCPNPIVNTSDKEVCQNEPIVVTAQAISGTPPYTWVVERDNQILASGDGGEVNYETGIISNEGDLEFIIKFTDHHGKTGTGQQTITILESNDQRCIACPETPNTQIVGGTGRTVDVGQNVMLQHTNGGTTYLSYSWRKDGVVVGTQKSYFFNATNQDIGTSTYTLKYEYAPDCFAETNPHVVTVTEENCECDVTMKVLTGVANLNGKTVTPANSTNPGQVCALGNKEISIEAQVGENCKEGGTHSLEWTLKRRKQTSPGVIQISTVATGSTNTFKYTPVQSDSGSTLIFELKVTNGSCVTTATGFSAPVSLCAGSQPFDINIADIDDICVTEASSVPFTFKVNARQQGSSYDTFPFSWKILAGTTTLLNGGETGSWSGGTKTITKNLNLSSYTGNNTITVEVRRLDTMLTVEEHIFVRVNNIDSLACTACADRNTQVTLTGAPNDQVELLSGQYTNVTANATSNVQTSFTYEWKRGNTVVSTSKTLSVNPTTTTNYTVVVKDSAGCTKSRTITVNVKSPCTDPDPMGVAIFYSGYTGGAYEVCPGETITITVAYDSSALPPTLYINGTGVPIPPNNIVTTQMSTTPMTVKLEGRKRVDCDAKSITRNIAVQSSCGCTLSSFGVQGPNEVCPGESSEYTVNPNGLDDGYTYTWYSDPNRTNVLGTGETYIHTLSEFGDQETLYLRASKSGCQNVNGQRIVRAGKCLTLDTSGAGNISIGAGGSLISLTRNFINNDCDPVVSVDSYKLKFTNSSGQPEEDITSNSTFSITGSNKFTVISNGFTFNTNKCPKTSNDGEAKITATIIFKTQSGEECTYSYDFGISGLTPCNPINP